MKEILHCFKAYDIRGRLPDELNEEIAARIGRAYAQFLRPRRVVVGYDIRLSSPAISEALIEGLLSGGADVHEIGQCGTEEVYFATFDNDMDGGIMVTASHNPKDFNGMKLVREASKPISGDTGLLDIKEMAERGEFAKAATPGRRFELDHTARYIEHLLGYVDVTALKPLKIVVNAGNGGAGRVVDLLEPHLPFEFVKIHHEPDGHFPNGVPNPLLPENRAVTQDAVRAHGADLALAWDGDFDRCFFFDERGEFVEGYYIVGLLAEAYLRKHPGEKIVHDPRLTWNTVDLCQMFGGTPIQSKTGHAFIKERMRLEDAAYGGEMSAHHYFRDFSYCDSGMIPWLLVAELIGKSGRPLSALLADRMTKFPASGEINHNLPDPAGTLRRVEAQLRDEAVAIDHTDGLSMEFATWRFNLRASNTEPVVRLNVESRGDEPLMQMKTNQLLRLLQSEG